jgi:hypothetical protein
MQAVPNKRAQLPIASMPHHQQPTPYQHETSQQQPPTAKLPLQFPPQRQQQGLTSKQQTSSSFVPTGLFQQPQPQNHQTEQQHAPPQSGSFAFAGSGGFQPTGMIPMSKAPAPHQSSEALAPKKAGTGVGSYNYGAAAAVGSSSNSGNNGNGTDRQDERSPPKKGRGVDGGIRFGRRAGSSDGTITSASKGVVPRRDASRNRNSQHDEERPRTDPSAVVETSPSRREVHYTPYSVNDYRRMKEDLEKKQSRGLGPSDTDEQRAAAQRVQRQKEYAENIKRVNQVILTNNPGSPTSGDQDDAGMPAATRAPIVQPTPVEVLEKQKMRDRANEYAKRVPRPKPKAATQQASEHNDAAQRAEELWGVGDTETKTQEKERHIADLEARHLQDQQMVANLKKQLRI